MKAILFALQRAKDGEPGSKTDWNRAVDNIESTLGTNESIERFGRGVWLCTGGGGLRLFPLIASIAKEFHTPYRVLFLDEMTDWNVPDPS